MASTKQENTKRSSEGTQRIFEIIFCLSCPTIQAGERALERARKRVVPECTACTLCRYTKSRTMSCQKQTKKYLKSPCGQKRARENVAGHTHS